MKNPARRPPESAGRSRVEGYPRPLFRFDDHGKIVEHWDVLQVIPPESAHGNTMF